MKHAFKQTLVLLEKESNKGDARAQHNLKILCTKHPEICTQ